MKLGPLFQILSVLLATVAASWASHGFLEHDLILVSDLMRIPYTYCIDNYTLSVDSLEISGPPTKGQDTLITFVANLFYFSSSPK